MWVKQNLKFYDTHSHPCSIPLIQSVSKTRYLYQTLRSNIIFVFSFKRLWSCFLSCAPTSHQLKTRSKMSQHPSPDQMHASFEDRRSSPPNSRAKDSFQMINLSDLVLDVVPLSTLHPLSHNEEIPFSSKNVKT